MIELASYDPLLFKSPKGVVVKQTIVNFKLKIDNPQVINKAFLMVVEDGGQDYTYKEMKKNDTFYTVDYKFEASGHFFYNFKLETSEGVYYISKTFDTFSYITREKGEDFFQAVLEKEYTCTDSMQGGLIYQIYTDRFASVGEINCREPLIYRKDWGGKIKKNTTDPLIINREVFGGNFKGIISKLDYLKSLGVTIIYLNPISLANSNHKYDTADYMRIDDMFGTEREFKKLIEEAKSRNIKIIIDGVYNHTGSDSVYFNKEGRFNTLGAYKSKESRFYEWFDFIEYPDKYQSWWGIDTLPCIKHDSEDYQEYITGEKGVIEKYLSLGVFGVRLDVVDEISDSFVKKIASRVGTRSENHVVMGEVWEDAATKISWTTRRKYFVNNELNSVMNYPIKESILKYVKTGETYDLVSTIRMLQNNYPKTVLDNLMNFLTTHDTGRIYSELIATADGNLEIAEKLYKIAFGIMFTVSGVPSIFYGDEYGMENNDGSSRGCFDWKNYENSRYEYIQTLSKIRKKKSLKDGDLNILYSNCGKFVFERVLKDERLIVLANIMPSTININLNGKFKSFFTGEEKRNFKLNQYDFEILEELK